MILTLIKVVLALFGILVLYLVGAGLVRNFARGHAMVDEEQLPLEDVDYRYRCSVCGAQVVMYAAPDEDPMPPRHCAERMDLITPVTD